MSERSRLELLAGIVSVFDEGSILSILWLVILPALQLQTVASLYRPIRNLSISTLVVC